ncbi:MAG: hypothetical protein ACRDP8_27000 [Actinopolymorphaceae bacterium]
MTHRIVVLGAGYAGLGAAKRLARQFGATAGDDVRVTLVNATDRFVERVRLHQVATGEVLRDLKLADLLAGTGIELVVGSGHRTRGGASGARRRIGDGGPGRRMARSARPASCSPGVPPVGDRYPRGRGRRGTPRSLRIRYVWQNISLGRRDGVTQFTDAHDRPTRAVLTGRASAAFKEAVTRSTVVALRHPGPLTLRRRGR